MDFAAIIVAISVAVIVFALVKISMAPRKPKDPVDIVRQTWAKVTEEYTHRQIGDMLYANLFASNREMPETIFRGVDQKTQSVKIVTMLDSVIKMLETPEDLELILVDAGRRHAHYSTEPKHFPVIGAALMETLSMILERQWTPEVRAAWTGVYSMISEEMTKGLEQGLRKMH